MGEYAKFRGQEVKIGTCEDMYYLRADQAALVQPLSGNARPASKEDQAIIRFRFPWPDEDGNEPGSFDPYWRGVAVPFPMPKEVQHNLVQFFARTGYLVSLLCPEGLPGATPGLKTPYGQLVIHRNGFGGAVQLVQQAYRDGKLVPILKCGGCEAIFRLTEPHEIESLAVACRSEGDRKPDARPWWNAVADRVLGGIPTKNGVIFRPMETPQVQL